MLENTKNISSASYDLVFDLNFDDEPESVQNYEGISPETLLILGAVKIQLQRHIPAALRQQVIGINALPSFLGRRTLEACTLNAAVNSIALTEAGWEKVHFSESRIGMITPRIICMIINEAYFTLQEGTASREDIDKGMKLGTAYPFGPFEWCAKIGIINVYEVLQAMASDTNDERYKICNLLKTEYLNARY